MISQTDIIFRQLFDADSSTYTYLMADKSTSEAALIDPVLEKVEDYLSLIEQLDLRLVKTLDTHTHADHITAQGTLRDKIGCVTMMGEQSLSECASAHFSDNENITLGHLKVTALYTPGHTDDSYCFLIKLSDTKVLLSGDTLLIRGTGRTDFQSGSAGQQYHSLFDRLLQLPEDTLVYPGHDYKGWTVSTIGEEKANNPRLQVGDGNAYIELMSKLDLPNPKMMDIAVPANQSCGNVKD
jgi:sulfur dioxygenase